MAMAGLNMVESSAMALILTRMQHEGNLNCRLMSAIGVLHQLFPGRGWKAGPLFFVTERPIRNPTTA